MKAQLHVLDDRPQGTGLDLGGRRTCTLGRGSHNDLQIRDRKASREHCRIEFDGEYFWLVDAESSNGTFVNDKRVQRYMLYDGDVIQVGKTSIVFRLVDAQSCSAR